jgi:hypothetical protein
MAKLPVVLLWEMRIENNHFIWRIGITIEHAVELQSMAAEMNLPPTYTHWHHGGNSGSFPTILPEDLSWLRVVRSSAGYKQTLVFGDEKAGIQPVLAKLDTPDPFVMLSWFNSDYVTGSRIMQAGAYFPETARVLEEGEHRFGMLDVDLGMNPDSAQLRNPARARSRPHRDFRQGERPVRQRHCRFQFRRRDRNSVPAFLRVPPHRGALERQPSHALA